MKTEILYITPELAKEMLKGTNRPISKVVVKKYANDIISDEFKTTHQGIAIGKSGNLLDGWHRLNAIILANKGIHLQVNTDVEDSLMLFSDIGKNRNLSDRLNMDGWKNDSARCASSTIGYIVTFKQTGNPTHQIPSRGNTAAFAAEFIKNNPRLQDSLDFATTFRSPGLLIPMSMIAFLHFCISEQDTNAGDFIHKLITGEELKTTSIIYHMREQIIKTKTRTIQINKIILLKRIIKTYYVWNTGDKLTDPRQAINSVNIDSTVRFF